MSELTRSSRHRHPGPAACVGIALPRIRCSENATLGPFESAGSAPHVSSTGSATAKATASAWQPLSVVPGEPGYSVFENLRFACDKWKLHRLVIDELGLHSDCLSLRPGALRCRERRGIARKSSYYPARGAQQASKPFSIQRLGENGLRARASAESRSAHTSAARRPGVSRTSSRAQAGIMQDDAACDSAA
jgi:hypothetical protein